MLVIHNPRGELALGRETHLLEVLQSVSVGDHIIPVSVVEDYFVLLGIYQELVGIN